VIHSGPGKAEIREGLRKALDPVFRKLLENLENPYGDGRAAPRMVEVLRQVDLADPTLIQKPFHDLPQG
jgi:UDP-N-acetylglucosamine 2-epimerase